jgi:predicted peptidase
LFLEEDNRSEFPCIVVVPQCPEDSYWASVKFNRDKYPLVLDFNYQYPVTAPLKSVVNLIHRLLREERVDLRRVYIMGLSMGGMGTLEAVYRNPGLFAAAVAICGGGDTRAYSKKQARIPFWLFHGDADGVIGVDRSRDMVRRLTELKANVKYSEYEGVNHNSWENAFKDPGLLPWLFSKRR